MRRLLTSCFGLGLLPVAPGTYGSIPPAVVFALMGFWRLPLLFMVVVLSGFVVLSSIVCIILSPGIISATGKEDPSEIVVDEFAGQSLTFVLALIALPASMLWTALFGFILFRIFDIIKPSPVRTAERLPAGWGILIDDLIAGAYAGVLLMLVGFWRYYLNV